MNYETVMLKEKYIAGIYVRTSNHAPDMGEKIGALWQKFYTEQIYNNIDKRTGQCFYGVYTNYENNVNGAYDVYAGAETLILKEDRKEIAYTVIPKGKYAKFSFYADMRASDIANVWAHIWSLNLDRQYEADFEEYCPEEKEGKQKVNIYIGLKEGSV